MVVTTLPFLAKYNFSFGNVEVGFISAVIYGSTFIVTTGNTWSLVIQVNWTWINSEYGTDVTVANLTMLPPAATASYLINATLVNTRH